MVVVQVTRSSSRHGESWDVFPHPNAPSRVLPLVVKRGRSTTDEIRLSLCNKKITITQIYSNENAKRRGSVKPHFWGHHWTLKETTHTLDIFDLAHLWKAYYFFSWKGQNRFLIEWRASDLWKMAVAIWLLSHRHRWDASKPLNKFQLLCSISRIYLKP